MQRFSDSNVFYSRSNRFNETGPVFEPNNINGISIGVGFKSKNDKANSFTNYLKSNKQKNYYRMNRLYNQIITNDVSFINNEYVCDEIYDNGKVVDRLINIINYDNDLNISKTDITHIYKLKSKENKKIHVYISLINDNAELILIDLYHLSMPGNIYDNKKLIKRGSLSAIKRSYQKFESYGFDLNNIGI